jgi:hypothetical protein
MSSAAEQLLAVQLEQAHVGFDREVRFIPDRRFRADFVVYGGFPELIVEVEGGTWNQGWHVRGGGFESGCEKQALAVIAGYRYLRVTSAQVEDGRALEWIRQALGLAVAA